MHVLLVDNYDSFTYNLAQAFGRLGARVSVHRNDALDVDQAARLGATHLVLSPGPGRPENAGITMECIERLGADLPVLGVCLGHQAIGAVFGGRVVSAREVLHGKSSPIYHDGRGLMRGLPNPFVAGRYHSLAIDEATLPDTLQVTAYTADGEIMGVRHRHLPIEGVQFHPESVLTPQGELLLASYLEQGMLRQEAA